LEVGIIEATNTSHGAKVVIECSVLYESRVNLPKGPIGYQTTGILSLPCMKRTTWSMSSRPPALAVPTREPHNASQGARPANRSPAIFNRNEVGAKRDVFTMLSEKMKLKHGEE
jgi:hypothetical protein